MSGIDEIVARIDAEALASENVLRAEYDDKIKETEEACAVACTELDKRAKEKAAAEKSAMRLRAENRAGTACRDELLSQKRALIDSVLCRAAKSFSSMDKKKYTQIMAGLLSDAASDEAVKGEKLCLMVAKNAPASGEELVKSSGVEVSEITETDGIDAGFILKTGRIEINCTPEKLIAQKREALLPAVTAALFG